jgi:hypothetical protein
LDIEWKREEGNGSTNSKRGFWQGSHYFPYIERTSHAVSGWFFLREIWRYRRKMMTKPDKMLSILRGSYDALRGDGVPLTNARAGLITPTTRAFAAAELMLCIRVMPQEVFVP